MKKLVSIISLFALSISMYAQNEVSVEAPKTEVTSTIQQDSIISLINDLIWEYDRYISQQKIKDKYSNRYKMYQTENIYNLLKLDTATGEIWQVQWSLDNKKEFTNILNGNKLSYSEESGTFELYPTHNMYQFILLNKTSGECWHVQWGLEHKKRWIQKIY